MCFVLALTSIPFAFELLVCEKPSVWDKRLTVTSTLHEFPNNIFFLLERVGEELNRLCNVRFGL